MSSCTEKTRRWPDAIADVSSDDMDEFVEHAEVCPYHAALLRAEEEDLRHVFRLARGFDSHGRILPGDAFQAAVAEHQQRWKRWNEAAGRRELPFSHISLYNHGEKIASCGKFLDFRRHDSVHELEPHAGIQIRGAISGDVSEEVLLGFYPLVGVRHKGGEYQLQLENGYTVGLRVSEVDKTTFRVEFRCVEHEMLEREQAEALAEAAESRKAKSAAAGGSIFSRARSWTQVLAGHVLSAPGGLLSYLKSSPTAMGYVSLLLVGAVTLPVLALVGGWGPANGDAPQGPNNQQTSSAVGTARVENEVVTGVLPASALVEQGPPEESLSPGARRRAERWLRKRPPQSNIAQTARILIEGKRGDTRSPASLGTRTPAETNPASVRPGDVIAKVEENSASWQLLASMGEDAATEHRLYVLHIGTDEKLAKQLADAIRASNNFVQRLNGSLTEHATTTNVKVDWNLQPWANGIEVQTVVYVGAQQATASFLGKGDCPEHASQDALGQAVPGINGLIEGLLRRQGIYVRLSDGARGGVEMVNARTGVGGPSGSADEPDQDLKGETIPGGGAPPEGQEIIESTAGKEYE